MKTRPENPTGPIDPVATRFGRHAHGESGSELRDLMEENDEFRKDAGIVYRLVEGMLDHCTDQEKYFIHKYLLLSTDFVEGWQKLVEDYGKDVAGSVEEKIEGLRKRLGLSFVEIQPLILKVYLKKHK